MIAEHNLCADNMEVDQDILEENSAPNISVHKDIKDMQKLVVPDGLEIIPIFKNTTSSDEFGHNFISPHPKQNRNHNGISNSVPDVTKPRIHNLEKSYFDKIKNLKAEGSQVGITNDKSKVYEKSKTGRLKATHPNEEETVMKICTDIEVNNSTSGHFLETSSGLTNHEVALTNLEMLIGQKTNGLFRCKLCSAESENKEAVSEHINIKHSFKKDFEHTIKCPFCPYKNINKLKLENHISSHKIEKPFQCTICNYGTTTKIAMKKHMFTHADPKPYKCSECPYASNEKYKLKLHSFNVHRPNKKPMVVQGQSTSHPISDAYPEISNSVRDPVNYTDSGYICAECGSICPTKSKLIKHLKTHSYVYGDAVVEEIEEENSFTKSKSPVQNTQLLY